MRSGHDFFKFLQLETKVCARGCTRNKMNEIRPVIEIICWPTILSFPESVNKQDEKFECLQLVLRRKVNFLGVLKRSGLVPANARGESSNQLKKWTESNPGFMPRRASTNKDEIKPTP